MSPRAAAARAPLEPRAAVTGIGSLPGRSLGDAVRRAFRVAPEIPFCPELPARSKRDGMIARALDETAPLAPRPFLDAVERRRPRFAKIQIAGPLTAAAALGANAPPASRRRVAKRIADRAIAAAVEIASRGSRPIVVLDEPALPSFRGRSLGRLGAVLSRIRESGACAGVHCCADADWERILALEPDVLSFDALLSLDAVLSARSALRRHLERGGVVAPGVVSTTPGALRNDPAPADWARRLGRSGIPRARLLLTPACGTGTLSREEDADVWRRLRRIQAAVRDSR